MKFTHHPAVKSLFIAFCLSSSLALAKPTAMLQPYAQPAQRVEVERASGPFAEWLRALRLMFTRSVVLVKR